VEALVEVLDHYSTWFPDNIFLATWIDDALVGAIHTYSKANVPVSMQFTKHLQIIIAKTNMFDPVMQQLPDLTHAAEMTTQETASCLQQSQIINVPYSLQMQQNIHLQKSGQKPVEKRYRLS